MNTYERHRFPPDIISHAARLYYRFNLSHRDTFFIDEVFVKINGKQHYLWRAVDQDGEVVDTRRPGAAQGACHKDSTIGFTIELNCSE